MWSFEIWNMGSCVAEDSGYDTEDEARKVAEEIKRDLVEEAWGDETEEDFEIEVNCG